MELPRCIFNELKDITRELETLSENQTTVDSLHAVRDAYTERYMIGLESFGAELWRILRQLEKTNDLRDTDVSGMLERLEGVPQAEAEVKRMGREAEFGRQFLKMKNVCGHIKSFRVLFDKNRSLRVPIQSTREATDDLPRTLLGAVWSEVVDHRVDALGDEVHLVMRALVKYTEKLVSIDRTQADISNTRYDLCMRVGDLAVCAETVAQQQRVTTHARHVCTQLEDEMVSHQQCSPLSQSDRLVTCDVSGVLRATRQRCRTMEHLLAALQQNKDNLARVVGEHSARIASNLEREAVLMAEESHALAQCPELLVLVGCCAV